MKTMLFGMVSITAIFFALSLSSCASGHKHHGHKCACSEGKKADQGCKGCEKKSGCDSCEVKDEEKKP
ncbi:MAG: hypothetical protein ACK5P7_08050 [Bdellovibrio sp.]